MKRIERMPSLCVYLLNCHWQLLLARNQAFGFRPSQGGLCLSLSLCVSVFLLVSFVFGLFLGYTVFPTHSPLCGTAPRNKTERHKLID